jgi:hypothetical protein
MRRRLALIDVCYDRSRRQAAGRLRGSEPSLARTYVLHQGAQDRTTLHHNPQIPGIGNSLPRETARLHTPLVTAATTAPGHRTLAPPQRPAPCRNRNRVTSRGQKGNAM